MNLFGKGVTPKHGPTQLSQALALPYCDHCVRLNLPHCTSVH